MGILERKEMDCREDGLNVFVRLCWVSLFGRLKGIYVEEELGVCYVMND